MGAVPRALEGDTRHHNRTLRRWSHGHLRRCRSCTQMGGAAPTGPRELCSSGGRPDARELAQPTIRSSIWQHCTSERRADLRHSCPLPPAPGRSRGQHDHVTHDDLARRAVHIRQPLRAPGHGLSFRHGSELDSYEPLGPAVSRSKAPIRDGRGRAGQQRELAGSLGPLVSGGTGVPDQDASCRANRLGMAAGPIFGDGVQPRRAPVTRHPRPIGAPQLRPRRSNPRLRRPLCEPPRASARP